MIKVFRGEMFKECTAVLARRNLVLALRGFGVQLEEKA